MLSRSAPTPSGSMAAAAASSRSTRLARMARCTSSSVGMGSLPFGGGRGGGGRRARRGFGHERAGMRRLTDEHVERWDVVVPFDERWNRTELRQRDAIERPYFGNHPRGMIVDPHRAAIGKRP